MGMVASSSSEALVCSGEGVLCLGDRWQSDLRSASEFNELKGLPIMLIFFELSDAAKIQWISIWSYLFTATLHPLCVSTWLITCWGDNLSFKCIMFEGELRQLWVGILVLLPISQMEAVPYLWVPSYLPVGRKVNSMNCEFPSTPNVLWF